MSLAVRKYDDAREGVSMQSYATYNISLTGSKIGIRKALFCLADIILDQGGTIAELLDKYDDNDDFDDDDDYGLLKDQIYTEELEIWQTHNCVWMEDIQSLAINMALEAPEVCFSFVGHIEDHSENAGDEMDFRLTYDRRKLIEQTSDWYQYVCMDEYESYAAFAEKFCDSHGNPRYSKEDFDGFRQCSDEWYVLDGGTGEFSAKVLLNDPVKVRISKRRT